MQLFAMGYVYECGERLLFCHMYIYIYIFCSSLFIVVWIIISSNYYLFYYSPFWKAYEISVDRIYYHMAKVLKACNSLKPKRPTNNKTNVCKWLYTTYSISNNFLATNNVNLPVNLPGYAIYCFIWEEGETKAKTIKREKNARGKNKNTIFDMVIHPLGGNLS